jgi:hypothetical protein
MFTRLDEQVGVRRGDIVRWQVALAKGLLDLFYRYVGKKTLEPVIEAAITEANTFKLS